MSNDIIRKLIKAIISFVTEKESYVTKTKLLKYLYLIDIEYYRMHDKTLTGFNWIYYHYGPWAHEYEKIYEDMAAKEELRIDLSVRPDLETQFLTTEEYVELEEALEDSELKSEAERILERWADEPLGKILDYVYFYTEPMERAIKGQPLDFSKVHKEKEKPYPLPKGTLSQKEIGQIKKQFYEKHKVIKEKTPYPNIEYGEDYWKGVKRLLEDKKY